MISQTQGEFKMDVSSFANKEMASWVALQGLALSQNRTPQYLRLPIASVRDWSLRSRGSFTPAAKACKGVVGNSVRLLQVTMDGSNIAKVPTECFWVFCGRLRCVHHAEVHA